MPSPSQTETYAHDVIMAKDGWYSRGLMFTALCVWEHWEIMAPRMEALTDFNGGVFWLRDKVVPALAIIIDGLWVTLPAETQDGWGAFDLEFVPAMLRALEPIRSYGNQSLGLGGWHVEAARVAAERKT